MQVIPYGHGGNNVRVKRKYHMDIEAIPYEHRGNIVRAWTGHGSVPPVTGTNIQSCVCTILCLYDLVFVRSCSHNYILRASTALRLNTEDWSTSAKFSTRKSDQIKNLRTILDTSNDNINSVM